MPPEYAGAESLQPSGSFRQRLHHATRLARRKPVSFLFAAGHRLLRAAKRRLRPAFSAERAERTFASRYSAAAAAPEAWRGRLARILPAGCLERENYLHLWSHTRPEVLPQAEQLCQHRFNLLGSGEVELGAEIDWHRDFKSGRRWPLEPSRRLPLFYAEDASDIKVVWELSRFQHLPLLGKAYWLTGDERFAREFAHQLEDWIEKNPIGTGPNWMVAMEAAVRGVNWLYASNFFAGSPALTGDFWYGLLRALFLHGCFIRGNLEWNPYARGNHYLADLVGLLYLGAFFSDSREGKEWLSFAVRELLAEIDHQVRGDGVAHEASLGYHRLVTELLLAGCLAAARSTGAGETSGVAVERLLGQARARKLEAMLEFVLHYTRPDGRAPLVGDADDGRLVQLAGYGTSEPADHRHLLCTGARLFAREDFAQAPPLAGQARLGGQATDPTDRGWEEAWWFLGDSPPRYGLAVSHERAAGSRAFPAGGFFVMRSEDVHVLIRCGDVGLEGVGAHAHCDQLSFELARGPQPLVIDPGSYVYTADLGERYRFRSTASHNTVRADGAEQNWISVREPFRMPDDTRARVRHWRSDAEADEFEGEHFGYERLPARLVHRRAFYLDKGDSVLYVLDRLLGRGPVVLEWFFHLAPEVSATLYAEAPGRTFRRLKEFQPERSALVSACALKAPGGIEVPLLVFSSVPLAAEVGEGWVSPRYGVREKAAVVSYRADAKLPVSALFVFDLGRG